MNDAAPRTETVRPYLEYGRVSTAGRDVYGVDGAAGRIAARRAAGCLLEPEPGDLVLISLDANGLGFILSVLTRREDRQQPHRLSVDGDLDLTARGGSICLDAEGHVGVSGRSLGIEADQAAVSLVRTDFAGRLVNAQVKTVNLLTESIDTMCRRLTQRLGSLFRRVETHQEIQSGSSRHLTDGHHVVQADSATILSENVSKIDGRQVQLG
jgi:hypothetical protein